jgi:hypothetical protein
MAYYLVQRFGPREQPQYRKEEVPTEPHGIMRAAEYFKAGFRGDFVIEDGLGKIVTNDAEIRSRCKITAMP